MLADREHGRMKFTIRLHRDSDNSYPAKCTEVAATDAGIKIRLQDADRSVTISWDDWEALVRAMPKRGTP